MIFVIVRNNNCIGYCTSHEQAIENVKKDINARYLNANISIDTNRNETKISVCKEYINSKNRTYIDSSYIIYSADFLS